MQQTTHAVEVKDNGLAAAGLVETGVTGMGLMNTGQIGTARAGANLTGGKVEVTERRRVEAVVETLSNLRGEGESMADVAHDARNMVTALGLYCDLLEEPGVLNPSYHHYANELRLVATASRRLVEKLLALDQRLGPVAGISNSTFSGAARTGGEATGASRPERSRRWDLMPALPIDNLAEELMANRNLLAALAGPSVTLTVDVAGGAQPVRLNGEDLTRILVNLVKNAAEAMPEGGSIQLGLRERMDATGIAEGLTLTVSDSGPGIPKNALDKIFDSGYTTHSAQRQGERPASHRGLGLSITRSIVEAAGGSIHAAHREAGEACFERGACFEIDLPVRSSSS
jgi:signal transduction histidine kinase